MSGAWRQTIQAVSGAVRTGGYAPQLNPMHGAQDTDTGVLSPGSHILGYSVGQSFGAECEAMTHHLCSEADTAWKEMHEVMYNHQLQYDQQLATFLMDAKMALNNM